MPIALPFMQQSSGKVSTWLRVSIPAGASFAEVAGTMMICDAVGVLTRSDVFIEVIDEVVGSEVVGAGVDNMVRFRLAGGVSAMVGGVFEVRDLSVTITVTVKASDVANGAVSEVVGSGMVRAQVGEPSMPDLCRETLDNCIVGVIMEATMTEAIKTSKRPNRMRRCQTQSQALVASCGHRAYRFPDLNCTEPSCCTSHSPSSLFSVSWSKLG